MLMIARSCVYTALIGNYEKLNEQPVARQSGIPFICLTDDPKLNSETWRVVQVRPIFPTDTVRSQRLLKLLPYRHLVDFEHSLYIDNSVVLTAPPEKILAEYLPASPFALPTHSFRNRVHDEFVEVLAHQLDDPDRIREHLEAFEASDPDGLEERPYWSGILLRDHTNRDVREASEVWAAHVLRYSRRDQLSSNHAFRQTGLAPLRIGIDNYASWFHRWPEIEGRKTEIRSFRSAHDTARQQEVARLLEEASMLRHRLVTAEDSIAKLGDEAARLSERLSDERKHLEAVTNSLSWKLTTPLRTIEGWRKRRL